VTTDKLSATVEADLLAEVRERAGPRGLSAFVSRALRHELDRVALRDLLDEFADQLGPPDPEMVAEADALLDELAKNSRGRGSSAPAA
jgi:hypothetical protein